MTTDRPTNCAAWVVKAEHDLLNIRNNLNAEAIPWDTVCFHAQQAAEKLLKAFLVYQGRVPPRTHDLSALLANCMELHNEMESLASDCRKLSAYAFQSRYPDALFEPTEDDGLEMVTAAERIRDFILRLLPAPDLTSTPARPKS
ncbi:MAG: HEPN domain-containing protein [Pseudomonadota bacterium]